jgi:hypothetical protein
MGLKEMIEKFSNPYERKARLWPALLTLLPVIVLVSVLYAPFASLAANTVSLAVSCGALYLLANIAREYGKRLEPKLFESWGGMPSTQILRHRNNHFGATIKANIHTFLANKLSVAFPDVEAEEANPAQADDIYRSAVTWLLSQTRDTKMFNLLYRENISYGFRRNALGLKPLGILIALGSIVWVLVMHGALVISANKLSLEPEKLVTLQPSGWLSIGISGLILVVWLFFFTRTTVRTAAFAYADTLIKSCNQSQRSA